MNFMRWMMFFPLLCAPAMAASCPPVPDQSQAFEAALAEARGAATESAGQAASDKMWEIWLRAPDETAQEILDKGMAKRRAFDFVGAFEAFDDLISYCPHYSEGYNQRAFVNFLREDYGSALVDLDRTLEITPDHVGARSGRALTLMNIGRIDEARAQMLKALEINPWLSERALLAKNAPLAPKGEDI